MIKFTQWLVRCRIKTWFKGYRKILTQREERQTKKGQWDQCDEDLD